MDSTELYDQFRSDVVDQIEPYLWTDINVYDYADDAQKRFCRLTGGLGDVSTASVTLISYTSATDWADLSPLILKTRGAYDVATGAPIEVVNYEDLSRLGLRLDGRTGAPKYLILGMEPDRVRLYPFPVAVGSIQLLVDRLPLRKIDDSDQRLEVADQHKDCLVMWMKARAYGKQDAETYDRNKSERCEMAFRAACAEAKQEKDRAKHKTRVVGYGGI